MSRLQPALATLALAGGIAAAACGDEDSVPGSGDLSSYLALEEGASWTYREVLDTGAVEAEDLMAARFQGDGLVALRDGARWADGTDAGQLRWAEGHGLTLESWRLGSESGSEPVTLVATGSGSGDSSASGGLTCIATFPTAVTSWYADFDDGMVVTCEGAGGLAGAWSFAAGFGLVRLEAAAQTLDLVAPW
ncbi:MAG: hypothetical protein ABIO70_22080 [Pseudomonadota bacterium]